MLRETYDVTIECPNCRAENKFKLELEVFKTFASTIPILVDDKDTVLICEKCGIELKLNEKIKWDEEE